MDYWKRLLRGLARSAGALALRPAAVLFAGTVVTWALGSGDVSAKTLRPRPLSPVSAKGVSLDCAFDPARQLLCNYRFESPSPVLQALASYMGKPLPPPEFQRTVDEARITILFLVDVSDAGRASTVVANAQHLRRFLDKSGPNFRLGLATFDNAVRVLAPLGHPPVEIQGALAGLHTGTDHTELYASVVEGIGLLAQTEAEQRILFLLSDGLEQGQARSHADAVAAAKQAAVTIYGVGYPRSVSLSAGLHNLRRLASETGGRFVAASESATLPTGFLDDPYAALDTGGRMMLDLSDPGLPRQGLMELWFETRFGPAEAVLELTLPSPPAPGSTGPNPRGSTKAPASTGGDFAPASTAGRPAAAGTSDPTESDHSVLWALLALAVILVIGTGTVVGYRRYRLGNVTAALDADPDNDQDGQVAPVAASKPASSAFLEVVAENEKRRIEGEYTRIGRAGENDIVLQDASVSRQHAVLERTVAGTYLISDLGSMNGLYVNNKRCKQAVLQDSDRVELGDAMMRFTLAEISDGSGEAQPPHSQQQTLVLNNQFGDVSLALEDEARPTRRQMG